MPIKKITQNEADMLEAIRDSQYHDGQQPINNPVWTWDPCLEFKEKAGGIVASLNKKDLIGLDNSDSDPDQHTIWMTQAGADALAAHLGGIPVEPRDRNPYCSVCGEEIEGTPVKYGAHTIHPDCTNTERKPGQLRTTDEIFADVKAAGESNWLDTFELRMQSHLHTLEVFKAKFEENPQYAFEWAEDAFEAAAFISVARCIVEIARKGIDPASAHETALACVLQIAQEKAIDGGRWPARSTSQTSNVAKQYETAAWASFVADHTEVR